jgi:hypothetical protein
VTTGTGEEQRGARWDLSDVSVRLVVVMLVLTVLIAMLGWQYRPGSGAYPEVPRRLALTIYADARSLVMTMTRTGSSGAVLTIYDDDALGATPAHGVTAGGWKVGIDGLGAGTVVRDPGRGEVPIPPDASPFDHLRVPVPRVESFAPPRLTDLGPQPAANFRPVDAGAPFYLRIRWREHAPVALDGAYLSAQLPGVVLSWPGDPPASIPMTTILTPRAGDLGQFSLQATTGPSVTGARSWTWHLDSAAHVATVGAQPSAGFDPIAFSAASVAETQQETVRAFIAGVLLGVAGGAVITLIAELIKVRRVRGAAER